MPAAGANPAPRFRGVGVENVAEDSANFPRWAKKRRQNSPQRGQLKDILGKVAKWGQFLIDAALFTQLVYLGRLRSARSVIDE
jgi:hypothetical protein